jgi:hypothetical protein
MPENTQIVKLYAGSNQCFAIESKNILYGWGINVDNSLGLYSKKELIPKPK